MTKRGDLTSRDTEQAVLQIPGEQTISHVALIGSFRQHYDSVVECLSTFVAVGLTPTTPNGTPIIQCGIPFVRFESDVPEWTDDMVQIAALHRILRADFVFVVAPSGYVGHTTCYEIGRVIQARRPIYFSDRPCDLPLSIPDTHIQSAISISEHISHGTFTPVPLHANTSGDLAQLERDLLDGRYANI